MIMKEHAKLKMRKTEKGDIENFRKIQKRIQPKLTDYFLFAVNLIIGSYILAFFCTVSVCAVVEFSVNTFYYSDGLFLILSNVFDSYRAVWQWPAIAAVVLMFWFRCNIRLFNYHFTRSVCNAIKAQKSTYYEHRMTCPRCNYNMEVKTYSHDATVPVGEKVDYYYERIKVGNTDRYVPRKKLTTIYGKETFYSNQAICSSIYCHFHEKKQKRNKYTHYKFFEMPYRISDSLHYAVWTSTDNIRLAGYLRRYRRGIPIVIYFLISLLICFICKRHGYMFVNTFRIQALLIQYLSQLSILLCALLILCIIVQTLIHFFIKPKSTIHC